MFQDLAYVTCFCPKLNYDNNMSLRDAVCGQNAVRRASKVTSKFFHVRPTSTELVNVRMGRQFIMIISYHNDRI